MFLCALAELHCGIGLNAAREKVRVARALKDLPKISAAFEQGRLSYSKVRAMTRIADASNEDYLLVVAKHGTAQHVAGLVSRYRRCRRLRDIEIANQQQQNRRFSYYFDDDGCLMFNGRLPAEQGALVVKALQMAVEKAFAEASGQREPEAESEAESGHQPEPIAARRADALATITETYMNSEPVANATGDRYQVVVHVSRDTLHDVTAETSDEAGAERAHLENGPHVTAETSRRIACDCSTVHVVEDDRGEPLSIGRRSRSIPPAIRRALRLRDRGCRFPGCTHTRFVDGHHIQHWADGGETSLDNLVLLCRRHHRLVHEGGYGCRRTADGHVVFTAPNRSTLPESWPLPGLVANRNPCQWFQRRIADLEIDSETCVPESYAGDTMDWHMAVSTLFDIASPPH